MKRFLLHLIADMLIVMASFIIISNIYSGPVDAVIDRYQTPFMVFLTIFLVVSFWFNKYEHDAAKGFMPMLNVYAKALFYTAGITALAMYLFQLTYYSRLIILGTILGIAILEVFWILIYQTVRMAVLIPEKDDIEHERAIRAALDKPGDVLQKPYKDVLSAKYRETILEETSPEVLAFLEKNIDIDSSLAHITATTTRFNILNLPDKYFETIVNLKLINDIESVNKFFESVNVKLKNDGLYINPVDTLCLRKKRIMANYPPILNWFVYKIDSIIHRVFPKIPITKKLYFKLTDGKSRVISKAEFMGRLYSCGFEVHKLEEVNNLMWFIAKRVAAPTFDPQPTYGPLVALKRVGKDGEMIKVYKMRTMHAYSEYLQDYIYKQNNLQEGGKFKNDFRVTYWGRFLRSLWLDELPMLLNVFNGDLKIVGVRPLSKQYFSLYDPALQEKRIKTKPGLIPPYYAQFPTPKTLDEVMKNEEAYLEAYFKSPFRTDFIYFWKAFYNIVFRRARSK